MKKMRINIFETNSSLSHQLVIYKKDEYDKFRNGTLYRKRKCENTLISKQEAEHILEDRLNQAIDKWNVKRTEKEEDNFNKCKDDWSKLDKSYTEMMNFLYEYFSFCDVGNVPLHFCDYDERTEESERDTTEETLNGTYVLECIYSGN